MTITKVTKEDLDVIAKFENGSYDHKASPEDGDAAAERYEDAKQRYNIAIDKICEDWLINVHDILTNDEGEDYFFTFDEYGEPGEGGYGVKRVIHFIKDLI